MPFLFLSPSTQEYNPYITTGNEEYWMNLLADRMEPYLQASAINVNRNNPSGTVGSSVRKSNSGTYDFHLALHSNAAPPQQSGAQRGVDIYYYPASTSGLRMANIIVDNLKPIYPLPDRVRTIASNALYELREANVPAVLCELGYHDNRDDALWVQNNLDAIARALVLSVTEYFGLPFLEPTQSRPGAVSTVSGPLNLRSAPTTSAAVLTQIPNEAAVTVYGDYNGWFVVDYGGLLGYAIGEYLTVMADNSPS